MQRGDDGRSKRSRQGKRRGRGQPRDTGQKPDAFHMAPIGALTAGLGLLTDGEIGLLKTRAFDLLAEHGVVIIHPLAQENLLKAGARPGADPDRYLLPRELVGEALEATPKSLILHGKEPGRELHIPREDGAFILRTGTGAHGYVDPRDASYRDLDLRAVAEMGAVASGLDQVGFVAHPFVAGVPEITADIHSFATMVNHTGKHCWIQPYGKENVRFLMEIAAVAAGGEDALRAKPIASAITCSFSPLEFKYMDTEVVIQAGRLGMPLHACSLPSAAGTAPLSPAGLVTMAAAEILSMLTVTHVLAPGTPVIATPLMFSLDMRTGSALQSSPETLQAVAMAVTLMKRGLGLPTHSYGAGSDTPDADMQSMAERAMLAQVTALSGADILGGIGQLECATVFSPVQAVLDNEIGAMVRKFVERPAIDDEALNWEEMSKIRTGGHFLDSTHTLALCRRQYQPEIFLREGRDDYERSGRRTAFDAARDKALDLIRTAPEEGVLDADQRREIARIRAATDRIILADETASQVI